MTMDYSLPHPAYYHPHFHHAPHNPHGHTAGHTVTSSMASLTSTQSVRSLDLSIRNTARTGNCADRVKREPFYHCESLNSLQHTVAYPLGQDSLSGIHTI